MISVAAAVNRVSPNAAKPNKKKQQIVTAVDARVFSDVVARALRHPRSFSDTVSFSEVAARTSLRTRGLADVTATSDLLVRNVVAPRTADDSAIFSENFDPIQGRVLEDSFIFSETLDRTLSLGRGSADTLSFVDALGRPGFPAGVAVDLLRLETEEESYSEELTGRLTAARAAADLLATVDDVAALRGLVRALADALTLGENVGALKSLLRAATDEVSVDELPVKVSGLRRALVENFSFSDAVDVLVVLSNKNSTTVQFADALGTPRDPATVAVDLLRLEEEQVSYSEELRANVTVSAAAADDFFFSDTVTAAASELPRGVIGKALVRFVLGGGAVRLTTGRGAAVRSEGKGTVRPVAGGGNMAATTGSGEVD